MALSSASGLPYADEFVESARRYKLTQAANIINAASRGAITINMTGAERGRKPEEGFINSVAGLVQSRDPAGVGTKTPVRFTGATHRKVNIFRTAPADIALQDFRDLGLGDEVRASMYGEELGEAVALDLVNAALAALVGAITKIGATAISDISTATAGTAGLTMAAINNGKKKFGDAAPSLVALATHSIPYFNLLGASIADAASAFHVAGTIIETGRVQTMGLTAVVSDAAVLEVDESTSTATNNYRTLLLVPGAVTINVMGMNTLVNLVVGDENTTPENILVRMLNEWQATISVKAVGYTAAATVNPTNAVLATSSNWEVPGSPALSVKQGPGVLIVTDGT